MASVVLLLREVSALDQRTRYLYIQTSTISAPTVHICVRHSAISIARLHLPQHSFRYADENSSILHLKRKKPMSPSSCVRPHLASCSSYAGQAASGYPVLVTSKPQHRVADPRWTSVLRGGVSCPLQGSVKHWLRSCLGCSMQRVLLLIHDSRLPMLLRAIVDPGGGAECTKSINHCLT